MSQGAEGQVSSGRCTERGCVQPALDSNGKCAHHSEMESEPGCFEGVSTAGRAMDMAIFNTPADAIERELSSLEAGDAENGADRPIGPAGSRDEKEIRFVIEVKLPGVLNDFADEIAFRAVQECRTQTRAAEYLGIDPVTLRRRLSRRIDRRMKAGVDQVSPD